MYRDPVWMLAPFLTGGKQAICSAIRSEIATGAGSVVVNSEKIRRRTANRWRRRFRRAAQRQCAV